MADAANPLARPIRPLSEDEISAWRSRLSAGRDIAKELVETGRKHVQRYKAKTLANTPSQHTVVVPLDYASVEQKKASLFQVPELIAEGRSPEAEVAAPLYAAIANHVLSPEGVNAGTMMFEVQTDVLIQGYAVTKIGYENVVEGTKPVPTGEMQPDPLAPPQPGAILGLGVQPPMVPVTVEVPNIISETYYWRRIPPGFLLAPAEFRGSNFDDAAFNAWRFCEDVPDGEKGYSGTDKDDELLLIAPDASAKRTPKRWGTEVWYKASKFDKDVKHPDVIRTFKIYDDEPIEREHRDSPFQRWVLDGKMTPAYVPGAKLVGMKGFPLHILTLRYLSDTAFPPSDVQMGAAMSDEISIGRTQVLRRRDRSLPQVLYDATRVDPTVMAKIERNENTGFIGVPGSPAEMFLPLDKGQFGRENFAFNDQAQQDYDKAWAHGDNGGTVRPEAAQTATKSNQIQQSIDSRASAERTRELEWFVAGAAKLMSLYQIFADEQDYVPLMGADGITRLQAWDKTAVPGPFILKSRPNSHIRLNPEADFQQDLQLFNLAGNAPEGNRMYMLQRLFLKRGWDPARALQQPPPKTPEPPKVALSVSGVDFVGPQAPLILEALQQLGLKFTPEAVQLSQQMALQAAQVAAAEDQQANAETEHGGSMETQGDTAPINKHAADLTGGMQGMA